MAREFKFADLGEGITEGELVSWAVNEGDVVTADQIVAEIETDKAVVEIPSPYAGIVQKLHYQPGSTVHVGDTLISFSDEGESGVAAAPMAAAEEEAPVEKKKTTKKKAQVETKAGALPALATPHVRRLAREQGVKIEAVVGTGRGGRITEEDIAAAAGRKGEAKAPTALAIPEEEGFTAADFERWGPIERVALKGARKKIAQHMTQAMRLTAPVNYVDEADVSKLRAVRLEQKEKAAERGAKLTYLPFIIKAIVTGLKMYPSLNASLIGDELIHKQYYNIGFAVDTPDGLIVPVIKDVVDKSLLDIALELQELSTKVRERKVDITDLRGSTFSITNLGSIGGRYFSPIINYPDSAILGLGRVYDKPLAIDGHVVIRPVMSLSITFDHRITDGATAARFMNHVIERLEDPQLLFLDID